MVGSCRGCGKRFSGLKMAHCSMDYCHQTFSTPNLFDSHRKNGKCLDPGSLGLIQNDFGTWLSPGERDVSGLGKLWWDRKRTAKVADDQVHKP